MKEVPLSPFFLSIDKPFKETTEQFLAQAIKLFNAQAFSLILALKEESLKEEPMIFLHQGLSDEYVNFIKKYIEELPGKKSFHEGKLKIFPDAKKVSPDFVASALRREGIRSYASIPIGWDGETYGVLTFYFRRKEKFKKNMVENLKIFASVFSSSVKNYLTFSNLVESRETLNTIFKKSPAATFIIQEHKYKIVNPAFVKITGYNEKEARKMNFWEIIHPDFQEVVKERGTKREKGERVIPDLYELKLMRKDGNERWILLRATPIKYQGKPANLGIAFDITEQKKLLEEVQYLQENLRTIYENSVMGIYLLDVDKLVYEMVNPMGEKILGMDIEGKAVEELFPPEEVLRIQEIVNYIKKTKKSLTTVEKYHTGLGERHIFVSRAPVMGKDGRVKKIVGIFRDITEESRAIRDWERRADLSMMEKLIEVVSRELNNILSILLASAEIGVESGIDETNWRRVRDKAKEAQEFILQLMEIGKGGSTGKTTLELNKFVSSMLYLLNKIISENIILEFKPFKESLYILTSPSSLKSAITHLVVNAKEAIEEAGKIEIILGKEGEFAYLEVKDTGRGMTVEEKERVFEPFFSTKSMEAGMGLGLTFVKKFVERSGGRIRIESSPGRGTSVKLYFPLVPSAKREEEEQETEAKFSLPEVLLVEDDPDVRKVETELLTILGYRVREASSGEEALKILREKKPPVLITDLSMPGMGGTELCKKVKEISPSTRVLLISGFISREEVEKFKAMGIDGVLHKPFGLDELRKALENLS